MLEKEKEKVGWTIKEFGTSSVKGQIGSPCSTPRYLDEERKGISG
jgi:hypothetical protein